MMSVNKERLRYLLQAYIDDNLNESEFEELKSYLAETVIETDLHEVIDELWAEVDVERPISVSSELIFQKIRNDPRVVDHNTHQEQGNNAVFRFPWRLTAGIAAMLCIAFSVFLYFEPGILEGNNEETT